MGIPDQVLIAAVFSAGEQSEFDQALQDYYDAADTNSKAVLNSCSTRPACRDGCALCCNHRVHARAHEIFLIAEFVQTQFTAEEQEALMARLASHFARISTITRLQHQTSNIPCPLLCGNCCSIYRARPLACRSYHSLDVTACQYTFDHPEDTLSGRPVHKGLTAHWNSSIACAHQAYEEFRYDNHSYELGAALLRALIYPVTFRHWRNRKKAFWD